MCVLCNIHFRCKIRNGIVFNWSLHRVFFRCEKGRKIGAAQSEIQRKLSLLFVVVAWIRPCNLFCVIITFSGKAFRCRIEQRAKATSFLTLRNYLAKDGSLLCLISKCMPLPLFRQLYWHRQPFRQSNHHQHPCESSFNRLRHGIFAWNDANQSIWRIFLKMSFVCIIRWRWRRDVKLVMCLLYGILNHSPFMTLWHFGRIMNEREWNRKNGWIALRPPRLVETTSSHVDIMEMSILATHFFFNPNKFQSNIINGSDLSWMAFFSLIFFTFKT